MKNNQIVIAVDFDGTCVTHMFPNIGYDIGAVPVLKKISDNGHSLMLWTMRSHVLTNGIDTLKEAVEWFELNQIPLWGINENPTQTKTGWSNSNKQHATIFIDDAALGAPLIYDRKLSPRPFIDWERVEKELKNMRIL